MSSSAASARELEPRARALFLGASNVRLALPELVREARARLGAPLDVRVSHGHGRSYLGPSRMLARGLSVIAPDAFWEFEDARDVPTYALIGDAGNDLVYGARAAPVAEAVESVVARLADRGARVVVAGLPLATIAGIGALRFHLVRTVFFPTRRVNRAGIVDAARELDGLLEAAAARRGAAFVRPDPDWYGIDPIHVRLRARPAAAEALLASWGPRLFAPAPALELLAIGRIKPAACTVLGRPVTWPQPSAGLSDRTRVTWI
jgi:hypothetical protein